MYYSDLGIILEIAGFFVLLYSKSALPNFTTLRVETATAREEEKFRNKWKWAYYELSGDLGQIARLVGIGIFIVGLAFQFSLINNESIF